MDENAADKNTKNESDECDRKFDFRQVSQNHERDLFKRIQCRRGGTNQTSLNRVFDLFRTLSEIRWIGDRGKRVLPASPSILIVTAGGSFAFWLKK